MTVKSRGLQGISVGDTAICTVGKEGIGLTYRGYDIGDLAEHASFEEVAYLLLYGELPNEATLNAYRHKLVSMRIIPNALKLLLETIPGDSHPMDVLRTAVSMLGTLEMPTFANQPGQEIADRLLACVPSILLYWYQFHHQHKRLDMTKFTAQSIAGFFLEGLHGKPPEALMCRALDVSLILYAEHEFNASTFAARVTASTEADFFSAIVTAIGTLSGPLHGGANEEAMRLIESFKTPALAEKGIKDMLAKKIKIMGFGHRIYKHADPRSNIIKVWSKKLSQHSAQANLYAISESIEKVMHATKNLFPNLDFYSATTYHFCGIPTELFTPVFVMSRISGWSAHILEQQANNRIIRPEADYVGPALHTYLPLEAR